MIYASQINGDSLSSEIDALVLVEFHQFGRVDLPDVVLPDEVALAVGHLDL
jgi:hypothetical protein